jgi:hypothetical protein
MADPRRSSLTTVTLSLINIGSGDTTAVTVTTVGMSALIQMGDTLSKFIALGGNTGVHWMMLAKATTVAVRSERLVQVPFWPVAIDPVPDRLLNSLSKPRRFQSAAAW